MSANRSLSSTLQFAQPGRGSGDVIEVAVLLLDGGLASTGIAPIEIFSSAGVIWNWLAGVDQRPRFRVTVTSLDGNAVRGMCGMSIAAECAIGDVEKADIVVISASSWKIQDDVLRDGRLTDWIRDWHAKGTYIVGICSAVAFVAESGLLDGRIATTHWGVVENFRQRYPAVRWNPDRFVTEDERVLCSGGVYGAADVSLYLVEKFCGREVALQTAKSLCLSMPRSCQSGYAALPQARPHSDERIREVEEFVRANYARELPIARLASRAAMGARNFIRRFKAATGFVPGAYIQMLRVTAAKEMLEMGNDTVQSIAHKVGYEDQAFFRRIFKRQNGMTPAEYRGRFAGLNVARADLARGPAHAA
jgi:transcriptional regulator GlxA family with amidase domain